MPDVDGDTRLPARSVHRLRLAAICAGLVLLTFSQSSGYEAADTKLDLVVTPLRFLRHALQMWDPTGAAGQTQDQAYGYLFPMGPFFVLAKLTALPAWVVQRSWESLLLVAAFLGATRLSRLLRVPGTWPRVAVGLAYALSPRMLSELGNISAELLPDVVLPWVLIPLARAARQGSPRRAAARSGVALLFAGGINATATLAILPMPLLFLLTRSRGRRRGSLLRWWVVAVVLSSLWWALPLVVLGKYSPPFLNWIESSAVTTGPTDLLDMLRGTDHWEGYLGPSVWPIGWAFVAASGVVLALGVVAAMGIAGLARSRTPERTFLLATLALGAVLLSLGHISAVGPPFAGTVRGLLDGPLNAFRNVHKFDPLIRLPVALGVGHSAARLAAWVRARPTLALGRGGVLAARPLATAVVLGVAVVAVLPALTGRVVPQTRSTNDPSWWSQTATWLGRHAHGGRALVVPGAGAPAYVWGSPHDDALQPLASSPWTVRDIAPITQPGYVRLLDAIEADLATGQGDPALPQVLARAGIRYLVVRNDLDTQRSGATPLRFVHAAVDGTPGLTRVARFGPNIIAQHDANQLVDLGLTRGDSAVDVYDNSAWRGRAEVVDVAGAVRANGSSDALLPLSGAGLAPSTPVLFGPQRKGVSGADATTPVLTDGIRRREFGFGNIDRYSQTLTPHAPFKLQRAAHDYLPAGHGTLSTVAYTGIDDVQASSSAADPTSPAYLGAQYAPWAALDQSASTAWRSSSFGGGVGQWLQVRLPRAVGVSSVGVAFSATGGALPTRVRVSTDHGSLVQDVSPDTRFQHLRVPRGATRTLRITVVAATSTDIGTQVAIATLQIPGVLPARVLNVVGPGAPAAMVFAATAGYRPACLTADRTAAACDRTWAQAGEEDDALVRGFSLSRAATYQLTAHVVLRPGPALDAMLDAADPIRAAASTTDSADPRERPGAAVDGDARTGWVAAQGDRHPTLTLRLPRAATVSALVITPLAGAPVTRPRAVQVRAGNTVLTANLGADGTVQLPTPVVTDQVSITVTSATLRSSTDSLTAQGELLPVGIGEVRLIGSQLPVTPVAQPVRVDCSAGLRVGVDGREIPLQVDAPLAQVLAGRPVAATPCGPPGVTLAAGRHEVALGATALGLPRSLTMMRDGASLNPALSEPAPPHIIRWGATQRAVRVAAPVAALLVVHENANAGWRATLHGKVLRTVMVDGWQQAWVLPAGSRGVVSLRYTPQGSLDAGLLVGVLAVLCLLELAVVRSRRRGGGPPPLTAWQPGRSAAVAMCVVAGFALGGVAGLVVAAVVLGGRFALQRAGRQLPAAPVAAGALALAGLLSAIRPAGSTHPLAGSWVSQLLCLLAITVVLGVIPLATRPPRR